MNHAAPSTLVPALCPATASAPVGALSVGSGPQRASVRAAVVAAAIAAMAALVATGAARAADLELTVDNIRSAQGTLMIAIYADPADYRKKALRALRLPAQSPSTTVRIPDLSPGNYAITMYQDRNDNAKLDSNLLGIPSEPYGFSGNPGNLMSPATWEQARFAFGPDAPRVVVKLSD